MVIQMEINLIEYKVIQHFIVSMHFIQLWFQLDKFITDRRLEYDEMEDFLVLGSNS